MPARRRLDRDPREALVRLVERLGRRRQFVTLADVERAARPSSRLSEADLPALVEGAVAESILLKDLRTYYDRKSGEFSERWVYRVNPRHPLVAALLD
jgi:hypothetical protein